MADPVLTSLCAICHISPPKYKCPRCSLRTCSLGCIKKHKAWSECSGARDATAYLPPSRLRTAAGVDHDYNFLHGIERSVEAAERLLVGERALVREEELRPRTVQEVRWRPGRDGRKRKVLVTREVRGEGAAAKGRNFERFLAQRLRKLNVEIVCAPTGMTRQKENHTTLNRRTGRINWQVEWLVMGRGDEAEQEERTLSKVMDDVPLYEAYGALLEEQQQRASGQQQHKKPSRGEQSQDPSSSTWPSHTSYPLQDPFTCLWTAHTGSDTSMWPSEKDTADKQRFQFFLGRSKTRSDLPQPVTKLRSDECLREILTNTRVLEFPTVYVLGGGETLPEGFVLSPKDTIEPQQGGHANNNNNKRKSGPGAKAQNKPAKKRRGGKSLEEGEVKSDEEGEDEEGEAGDVITERVIGEDEEEEELVVADDDEDDDDMTSSSGSDSDSD